MLNFQNFIRSKTFKIILCGIGVLAAMLAILHVGILIGYHKATFSFGWGDNYYRTFGGSRRHFGREFPPQKDLSEAHGVAGKILSISLPTFVVEGRDNVEKVVLIKDDTVIRHFRDTLKPADLKVDDEVVIIGAPNNQAQVEAKLIRLMPPMSFRSMTGNGPRM